MKVREYWYSIYWELGVFLLCLPNKKISKMQTLDTSNYTVDLRGNFSHQRYLCLIWLDSIAGFHIIYVTRLTSRFSGNKTNVSLGSGH